MPKPFALVVAEDLAALNFMQEILAKRFTVIKAERVREACTQLERQDVTWDLIVVNHPFLGIVSKEELREQSAQEFIKGKNSRRGGLLVLERARELGLKPRHGLICGWTTAHRFHEEEIRQARGTPVLDDDLEAHLRRLR